MHDVMIYPPSSPSFSSPSSPSSSSSSADPAPPAFLVEHDATWTSSLRSYFKRHILRSKVKLGKGAEGELQVTAAWRNEAEESTVEEVQAAEAWLEGQKAGLDPRVLGMGYRWVASEEGDTRMFPSSPVLAFRLSVAYYPFS